MYFKLYVSKIYRAYAYNQFCFYIFHVNYVSRYEHIPVPIHQNSKSGMDPCCMSFEGVVFFHPHIGYFYFHACLHILLLFFWYPLHMFLNTGRKNVNILTLCMPEVQLFFMCMACLCITYLAPISFWPIWIRRFIHLVFDIAWSRYFMHTLQVVRTYSFSIWTSLSFTKYMTQ